MFKYFQLGRSFNPDYFSEPPLFFVTVCKIFHIAERGLESLYRDMHDTY